MEKVAWYRVVMLWIGGLCLLPLLPLLMLLSIGDHIGGERDVQNRMVA